MHPSPSAGVPAVATVPAECLSSSLMGAPVDESGVVLLGVRFFDPGAGTFLSVDPELSAGVPAQFNAYVYAGNNPVTWSDPSGRSWFSDAWKNVSGFVKKYKAEITGFAVGAFVTAGCLTLTAGAGSVGCFVAGGMAGGAVTNLIRQSESKKPFNVGSLLFDTAVGGLLGAAGPAAGAVAKFAAPAAAAVGKFLPAAGKYIASAAKSGASGIKSFANGARKTATPAGKPGTSMGPSSSAEPPRGGVYSLRDEAGGVVRTGRSKDLAARESSHANDPVLGDYRFSVEYRTDVYAEQRGLEQMLYDSYPGAQAANGGLNKIRGISPSNPNLDFYLQSARDFLE